MGYYDKANWHYGAEDFPKGAPEEKGGTHIGMFLTWCIINKLEGELHKEDSKEALEAVRKRQMTGTQFLFEQCDERFGQEDLNEEGNAFAQHYYEANIYYSDYDTALGQNVDSMYEVEDNWKNFDLIEPLINKRFREWKKPKSSWKFWKK